jgi:phage terminase large subunit-like protein
MQIESWPPYWLTPVPQEAIDRGDGEFAIEFTEAFGSIGKDGIAGKVGEALKLREWQKELIRHVYARDEDGGLKFRTAYIGMPRKSGKSALSATAFGLYSLLAEGIEGGEVYSVAAEKEQARIVFGEAKRIVESTELSEMVKVYKDAIFVPKTNSVYRVVSAESYSKEGLNPSRIIFDEAHAHKDRTLFDVFSLAMGNRGKLGQMIGITTAGVKKDMTGGDSIAYTLYQYGQKVARGEVNDPSFFMAWWQAPDDADHRDPEIWKQANPGFDDLVAKDDFESAIRRTPENEFRTKRLNQFTSAQTAWLPAGSWDELEAPREIDPDTEIILGFDGSFSGDCTVLVAATIPKTEEEKPYLWLVKAWEKDLTIHDDLWRVDIQEVEQTIRDFVQKYPRTREVACDPFRWQRSMEVLQDQGVPIVEFPSTSARRMVQACAKFYDSVTGKTLEHDGDPTLARHLDNAVTKIDNLGIRIVKENRHSPRKIDAAVAAVIAFDRAVSSRMEEMIPDFFY